MPDHDTAPELLAGLGSRALRNTVLVLAAKVVARLIALVAVLATLNHLGAPRYGTFITLVNYTAIVSVGLDLGFNVLYVREGALTDLPQRGLFHKDLRPPRHATEMDLPG